jgi:polyisoprenoid-binding protein YceI
MRSQVLRSGVVSGQSCLPEFHMRMLFSLVLTTVVAGFSLAADGSFTLTGENTKIGFTGTKKDGKHVGSFKKLTGTITSPDGKITGGKIEVSIEMDSVETDADGLTTHLKGADFFDVKTNPKSTFESTKIETKGEGYQVTGNFTLNGKKKEITFPAKIAADAKSYTLTADFKIDRTDYGIKYGQGKIDNEVPLTIKIAAK